MPTPSKRDYYHRNLERLRLVGISTRVKAFTKIEKMTTRKYKAPRMIQARDPTFNIEYGRFIKPLENLLTKKHHLRHHFGKGNYDELSRRIMKLACKYRYYTEGDHKNFDAHVTVEQLRVTHRFYHLCYLQNSKLLRLSRATLRNRVKTTMGDKYAMHGTRMSGDVDTSLGNSLINQAILRACLERSGIRGEVIVNGDDFIMFTNTPVDCERFATLLRRYNMETIMKESTTDIHQVEFCRLKVVLTAEGQYTMLIDPKRALEVLGMTSSLVQNYQDYLWRVLWCYTKINKNSPFGLLLKHTYKAVYQTGKLKNMPPYEKVVLEDIRLSRDVIRVVEREWTSREAKSSEITQSMYIAWPYLYDISSVLCKLTNRLSGSPPVSTRSLEMDTKSALYIDHINKVTTLV